MPKIILTLPLLFLYLFPQGQTAGFAYQSTNDNYCVPATVQFTQTCTGNPTAFLWNFGNGQVSRSANPSIFFNSPGTFRVKLLVVYLDQALETYQTIVIHPQISTTLTADKNYICIAGPINFSASNTSNMVNYDWIFDDGSVGISTATPTATHQFTNFGTYNVRMRSTNTDGCSANATYTVKMQAPPIIGSEFPIEGCTPALVNFGTSVIIPLGSLVSNYSWNYGDGNGNINTPSGNSSHTYSAAGMYSPKISITTDEGCTNSFTFPSIAFGVPPTNLVAFPNKTTYCGSETPIFVAKSTNANLYLWDFGDGTTARVTDTITSHQYGSLGSKTVTVTPFYNGCAGLPTSFEVEIIGVLAGYNYSNTCSAKNIFSFVNYSQGNISSYLWDFGDASPTVNVANTVHQFTAVGSFLTRLTISDTITGCSDYFYVYIHTGPSTLTNPDSSICRNSNTRFTITNNQNNPTASYNWRVVGLQVGPSQNKVQNFGANVLGFFSTNYVIINNGPQYCADTSYLNHTILVRGPNLKYTAPASICLNSRLDIANNSSAFIPTDTVRLWYWNYGQWQTNDSMYQPAPISYDYAGNFILKLVAKDKNGCVDSLMKSLRVNPIPFVQIIPKNDTFCFGEKDTLTAYHSDVILWTSGSSLPCSTCDTLLITPNNSTLYIATATNAFNCISADTSVVTVFNPFVASAEISPQYICIGDSVRINVTPPHKIINWAPPMGLSATNTYQPMASPSTTTIYRATLSDSVSCFTSIADVKIIVKTSPTVEAGPNKIFSYNAPFTLTPIYSNNVMTYMWDPTSTLSCINCPQPSGIALTSQAYSIKVTSDSGCIAKDSITISVECKYANLLMPTAFSPNGDFNNDRYYPITRGVSKIKKFFIYNRYGQLVFSASDFSPNISSLGWDGMFKGQAMSPDSYVYILEAVCDLGGIIIKKGAFMLIR